MLHRLLNYEVGECLLLLATHTGTVLQFLHTVASSSKNVLELLSSHTHTHTHTRTRTQHTHTHNTHTYTLTHVHAHAHRYRYHKSSALDNLSETVDKDLRSHRQTAIFQTVVFFFCQQELYLLSLLYAVNKCKTTL